MKVDGGTLSCITKAGQISVASSWFCSNTASLPGRTTNSHITKIATHLVYYQSLILLLLYKYGAVINTFVTGHIVHFTVKF